MAATVISLPIGLNVAVALAAFSLLLWLGGRVFRTPLWMPLLLLCSGMMALAFLDLAGELAGQAGAANANVELDLAAGSGTTVTLVGLLHFAAIYPRRVEARWVGVALLLVYAAGLISVVLAPTRMVPVAGSASGATVAAVGGPVDALLLLPLELGLFAAVGWFCYLALAGRNEKERTSARSLAVTTAPPLALGFLLPATGVKFAGQEFTLMLMGLWLAGLGLSVARGGLPLPIQTSLRRMMDASGDALLIVDRETLIVAANRTSRGLLGLEAVGAGRPFETVLRPAFTDADGWSKAARLIGDALLTGSTRVEAFVGPVGPQRLPCRLVVDPLRIAGSTARSDGAIVRITDITAERAAEEASARAHDMQDLVIRVMGHDLKTPIAVIGGYLDLVDARLSSPLDQEGRDGARGELTKARQAASLMQVIMANARAVSRITMGTAAVSKPEEVDLSRMVREVSEILRPLAQAKAVTLKVVVPAALRAPMVPGFESVITNLTSNAIKYTPEGGEVHVELSQGAEGPRLEVADTGPGIPADVRPKLFKKFERLSAEQSVGSHGLGLSISSGIVALAGGTIEVLDRPDGRTGSVFRVELPISPPAPT